MVEIRYRPAPPVWAEHLAPGLAVLPVESCWEDWMRPADRLREDPELGNIVYQALRKRRPQSRTRGRLSTPAEGVLGWLVLQHVRQGSYPVLAREVRANRVYRPFPRLGLQKAPHAQTLGKLGLLLGPETVPQWHQRVVAQAPAEQVIGGQKLRVDTTLVETHLPHPTDRSWLGEGVRVLTRTRQKIHAVAGQRGEQVRHRQGRVTRRWIELGRATRGRGPHAREKRKRGYRKLLSSTGPVWAQAQRFAPPIEKGGKRWADVFQQAALEGLQKELNQRIPRVPQGLRQTRARILQGIPDSAGKITSRVEHTTEILRTGQPGKPTELGKRIKVQEAENPIITSYQVYNQRPADSALLLPAIESQQQRLGVVPRLVAGDAGFFSAANETGAEKMGVQQVAVAHLSTQSPPRKKPHKEPWFPRAQKGRLGCEGRIRVRKRRHGLNRCRYQGDAGMHPWVGLGVLTP